MAIPFRKTLSTIKNKIVPRNESRLVSSKENEATLKPRIHIGCGPINLEGWINIDARNAPHVHIHTNVIDLNNFADGSVGEIYLCHVLEHFNFVEVKQVLDTFLRKLKKGGVLRISVPDFSLLAASYLKDGVPLEMLKYALMGGQDYEYNYHKSIYDFDTLKRVVIERGFSSVARYNTLEDFGIDLGDWSTGKIANKEVSLNIKAIK